MMRRRNEAPQFCRSPSLPLLTKALSARMLFGKKDPRQPSRPAAPSSGQTTRRLAGRGHRPRVSLEHLAKRGKFKTISKKLNSKDMVDDDVMKEWLNENCCYGGETALHKLLRFQPPASLVNTLVTKLVELNHREEDTNTFARNQESAKKDVFIPEDSHDGQGRTPLHIAVASGCHIKVIDRLLDGVTCTMPAMERDNYGRYPLHWLCTNPNGDASMLPRRSGDKYKNRNGSCTASSSKNNRRRGGQWASAMGFSSRRFIVANNNNDDNKTDPSPEALENTCRVICRLVGIFPEALCLPDDDGCTPIDLAVLSKADDSILELLNNAMTLFHKVSGVQRSAGNKTEDTLEMPLEVSHSSSAGGYYGEDDDVSSLGAEDMALTVLPSNGGANLKPSLSLRRITV